MQLAGATTDVWDILRAINVPLLLGATLALFVRFSDAWPHVTRGWQLIRVGSLLLFLGVAVGSAVRYTLHAPSDWVVTLPTAAAVLVLAGAWMTRHDDPEPRP